MESGVSSRRRQVPPASTVTRSHAALGIAKLGPSLRHAVRLVGSSSYFVHTGVTENVTRITFMVLFFYFASDRTGITLHSTLEHLEHLHRSAPSTLSRFDFFFFNKSKWIQSQTQTVVG